jgi:aspartate/tyrosine/aromatic aminotransferase
MYKDTIIKMKAQIEINLDNDIFQLGGGLELARLLRNLAEDVENNNACNLGSYIGIMDVYGNRVGEFEIVAEETDANDSVKQYKEVQEFFEDTE